MVSGLEGRSYEDRLVECGLTTLEDRRQRGDMIEVFKILKGIEDVDKSSWFTMANEGAQQNNLLCNTRDSEDQLKVIKPRWKHDQRKHWFSVRVCDSWNSLPYSIRDAKSLNSFKNSYDAWYKEGNR